LAESTVAGHLSAIGIFCCKSLFALAIKNSFGRRRDFRVKMWGTSSPEDKLTGDLGNVIEATSIVGRIFLQQENWCRAIWDFCKYRHIAAEALRSVMSGAGEADVHLTGIRRGEPD
jgi:hypothetical protein